MRQNGAESGKQTQGEGKRGAEADDGLRVREGGDGAIIGEHPKQVAEAKKAAGCQPGTGRHAKCAAWQLLPCALASEKTGE